MIIISKGIYIAPLIHMAQRGIKRGLHCKKAVYEMGDFYPKKSILAIRYYWRVAIT